MADRKTTPGGDVHNRMVLYHDEGDGTSSESFAAHLRGWNTSDLVWSRVAVNGTTGALLVEATLSSGDIQIGAVEIKDATTADRASVSAAGAVKVDGSAVTQPVSLASVPTHAVTATDLDIRDLTSVTDSVQALGNVAGGAADSGNPVKAGAVYNSTKPTYTTGQRSDLQTGSRGALMVQLHTGDGTAGSVIVAPADGATNTNPALIVQGRLMVFNGTTWDMARGDITNGLDVDVTRLPALVAGSATVGAVNQTTGQGKTLLFGAITQGAAGTTQLVAADATKKVKLVSYVVVLDAAGSFKFTDGTADLTGVIPLAINGGISAVAQPAAHLLETAAINRALSITTVGGRAFGHFSFFLEA